MEQAKGMAQDVKKREPRARSDSSSATWKHGWIYWAVMQMALIGALIWVGYQLRLLNQAQMEHAISVSSLGHKSEMMTTEIDRLRQFMASETSEEVIFLKMNILKPGMEPKMTAGIARLIHRYAGIYHQDADLIISIMYIESQFDPQAKSHAGALGLMQVMPQWQKVLGMSGDLHDPEISLKYGLQILGFYQEMYKDMDMALTAYNRGPGPIDVALMKGKNFDNGYAGKVLGVYERLKGMNIDQI